MKVQHFPLKIVETLEEMLEEIQVGYLQVVYIQTDYLVCFFFFCSEDVALPKEELENPGQFFDKLLLTPDKLGNLLRPFLGQE